MKRAHNKKKIFCRIMKVSLAVVLSVFMVYTQIFQGMFPQMTDVKADAGEEYTKVYQGKQNRPLVLSSGRYLFDNVTVNGTTSQPSAVIIEGKVTIVIKGTNTLTGKDAHWSGETQYPSGAGIELETVRGYVNHLTIEGDASARIVVKGGNANKGENGKDGTNGSYSDGGYGSRGGMGGNGASAGIGGRGGIGGKDKSLFRGKDSGKLSLMGAFSIKATGGEGGEGGRGGSGGSSHGKWYFFSVELAAGGGGGGGGGGGYPASNIGGGGAAGDYGGNGTDGEGTWTTTLSAFNESGGGGGGGGRGWGAGGGGGSGFFAYYIGQPKWSSIRPPGGKGGKNPWTYGEGGRVGIMEASLGGSGSDAGAYILRVGSYSGDPISIDDRFSGAGYIETSRSIPGDLEARRNGRRFGGLGARTCREVSDWGGYGLDCGWAFIMQGGEETPEATNGAGLGRRYELWIRTDGGDGQKGEASIGGKGGENIEILEPVVVEPGDSGNGNGGNGNGGGMDQEPGEDTTPEITIIDLSLPGTQVIFTPPSAEYDKTEHKPQYSIISSTGIPVDPNAYTVSTTGDTYGPGEIKYVFTGKGEAYKPQYVINSTDERIFTIDKGKRTSYLVEKDEMYSREMGSIFNVVLNNYEDDKNTVTYSFEADEGVVFETVQNGPNVSVISKSGTGKIVVNATISDGEKYYEQVVEPITLYITAVGADMFTISPIPDQEYTGNEIKPPFDVSFNGNTLEQGKDYEFTYENNVEIGRGKVIVVGKGDYEGTFESYFNIVPADISPIIFGNADYTTQPPKLPDLNYTGFPQTSPPIDGVLGGKEMVEGTDYLVSYDNLTEVGKVIVTVVGIGNYTNSTTLTYDILPTPIDQLPGMSVLSPVDDFVYDGTEKTPKPRVIFNGRELVEGVDYTLRYENNVKAGTASIYVDGIGNFAGDGFKTVPFTIHQKPIYVVPDSGQGKISGEQDPKDYAYSIEGVVSGDEISFVEGSRLERQPGDGVGEYRFQIGSMALKYGHDDNDNYVLYMTPDVINYSIKAYETDEEAIIRGEIIDEKTKERAVVNDETGWWNHRVEVVAPEGYLISRNSRMDSEGVTPGSKTSFWQEYFTSEDGDFSDEGQTYYLMKKPSKSDGVYLISQPKQVHFKQDSVNPDSRIEMDEKKIYTESKSDLQFTTYFQDRVKLDIIASDATSGIKKNQYHIADKELSIKELKELATNVWKDGTQIVEYSLELQDEMKAILYVRSEDVAGNVTYINTDGFIIDHTSPTIDLTYNYENQWTAKKDAEVKVHVKEELSGIDERYMDYHYEFIKDGRVSDPFLIKLDEDGNASIRDLDDGDYTFIVTAKDKAGNIETASVHVMVDTMEPTLEVSGNISDYATYKDVDIKANVGPSGVEKVYVQKQLYGDPCDENGAWVEITDDYNNGHKHRVDENGTYYFKYENGAGVTSNIATISFDTIDKAQPNVDVRAITVSDNQNYPGASWTNDNVKVFFKNTQHNLGDSKYAYRLKNDTATEWGDWQITTRKNDYEASVLLSQSGKIDMEIKIISAAGVESATSSFQVWIDKQNPTGVVQLETKSWSDMIQKVSFESFFNTNKQYVVEGNDRLSGVHTIHYQLMVGENAKKTYTIEELETLGNWTIGQLDPIDNKLRVDILPDNQYVLYAKITDQVGNVRYVSSDGSIVDATKPDMRIDKGALKEYPGEPATGKWIVDAFATLPVEMEDVLAGNEKLVTSFQDKNGNTISKEYDISTGNTDIIDIEEGIYDLLVQGYDKAGNVVEEIVKIQKDSILPNVNLIGDTENIGKKKHVNIQPIVGSSGIQSLGYQFVPEGTSYDENGSWTDILQDYGNGFDVNQNGTYYVRIENNLGITNIVPIVFENIMEAPVDIIVDTVDEDGNLIKVNQDGWYPAIDIRFYNNPKNVSDFKYEYHTGDGNWVEVQPEDGYAYIEAKEGETTYYVRVSDNDSGRSDETSITVRVDTSKPIGELVTTAPQSRRWSNAQTTRVVDYGLNEKVDILLQNVKDVAGSSGLDHVDYYVMSAGVNQQLKDFPADEKAVRRELIGKWIPMNTVQMTKLKEGGSVILDHLNIDQEYMVYVRIKDIAGNVRYITSDGITIDATKPEVTTDYKEGTWISDPQKGVEVHIKDNLSGVRSIHYELEDENQHKEKDTLINTLRDGKFTIPANKLKEGSNVLIIEATDIAGNIMEPYQITILKDSVKPVIKTISVNSTTHQVGVEVIAIGKSGIKEVYVTCDNGVFEKMDITNAYGEGIQIPRNGTYTYVLVNHAGVKSEPVSITVDDLSEPAIAIVDAVDGKGDVYEEGTWSYSQVSMQLHTESVLIGKALYQYSLDGMTWETMSPNEDGEFWVTQREDGDYTYAFRIVSVDGATSNIVSFHVLVDTTIPTFRYEMTPKTNTNKWVDVEIIPDAKSDLLEYSFDGGETYQSTPQKRFISNGYVQMAVRNKTGTEAEAIAKIENIDRLSPLMTMRANEITEDGRYSIELDVDDAPENLDFIKTGVDQVFLTASNPYSETNVRTKPLEGDYILEVQDNHQYATLGEFKAEVNGNKTDNYWIIANDRVGNYKIKSFRVNPESGKGEELPDPEKPNPEKPEKPGPEKPEDPNNPDIPNKDDDMKEKIDEIEVIDKMKNVTVEVLVKREEMVNNIIDEELRNLPDDDKTKENILSIMETMNLSREQQQKVAEQQRIAREKEQRYQLIWIPIVVVMIAAYVFYYYKKRQLEEAYEEDEELE